MCKECKYRQHTNYTMCPELCTMGIPYKVIPDINKQPKECPLLNKKAHKRNLLLYNIV